MNPDSCTPHPTSTYTYRVTNALRVCGGKGGGFESWIFLLKIPKKLPELNYKALNVSYKLWVVN